MANTHITVDDMCERILNRNPQFHSRLHKRERALQGIILGCAGKYFDVAEGKVKHIPEGHTMTLDENGYSVIQEKGEKGG